jgi:hypothetical protein
VNAARWVLKVSGEQQEPRENQDPRATKASKDQLVRRAVKASKDRSVPKATKASKDQSVPKATKHQRVCLAARKRLYIATQMGT